MTDLRVAPAAAKRFFGAAHFMVVSADIAPHIARLLPGDFPLVILDAAGVLTLPGHSDYDGTMPLSQSPAGLRTIFASPAAHPLAEKLTALYRMTGAHIIPAYYVLQPDDDPASSLVQTLAAEVQRGYDYMGRTQQQLVELRQSSERLRYKHSLASSVLGALGTSGEVVAYTLMPGCQSLGPAADIAASACSQHLPALADMMTGFDLFFAAGSPGGTGQVQVSLRRAGRGDLIYQWAVDAADIQPGARHFSLPPEFALQGREADLHINWSDGAQGPAVLLSPERGSHMANSAAPRPLALRLYRDMSVGRDGDIPLHIAENRLRPADLLLRPDMGEAALAALQADLGFPVVSRAGEDWVQIHPILGHDTPDFKAGQVIPPAICRVVISVITAHSGGPAVTYHAAVEGRLRDGQPYRAQVQKTIGPAETATLILDLPAERAGAGDLCLAVMPASDTVSCAWCRFTDVLLLTDTPENAPHIAHRRVTAERFPSFAGRLDFLEGPAALSERTEALGFSPLLLSEDGGYMQTHPLADAACGAVMTDVVPQGSRRVVVDIGSAHDATPAIAFAMLQVQRAAAAGSDLSALVTHYMRGLTDIIGSAAYGDMVDGPVGTDILACRATALRGRMTGQLSFDFDAPLEDPASLIWCTWSLDGDTSYGWCRWYGLYFEQ